MTIEQTPRGWVATESGLAARGATREEAQERLRRIIALVRRHAETWEERNRQPVTPA
jgi:hypothetical protein